jgi:hypothetical protein
MFCCPCARSPLSTPMRPVRLGRQTVWTREEGEVPLGQVAGGRRRVPLLEVREIQFGSSKKTSYFHASPATSSTRSQALRPCVRTSTYCPSTTRSERRARKKRIPGSGVTKVKGRLRPGP